MGGRKVQKEVSSMEEAVNVQRGKTNLHKKHSNEYAIYNMSLFRIPKVVKARLEKIQMDFFVGRGKLG